MSLINPALVLAFCLSLVAVWLNDVAVSWGRRGTHRVVLQSIEQIIYGVLRTHGSYSTKRFSISVIGVEGRRLIRPTLTIRSSDAEPPIVVTAEEAELKFNPNRNSLSIIMDDSEFQLDGEFKGIIPGISEQEVPLAAASRKGALREGPSDLPLWRIPDELRSQRREIERLEQVLAAEAGHQLLTGDFDAVTDEFWGSRQVQLDNARRLLTRLQTEPWRRWANGFSCFFFVLVGAPLAIRMRSADVWSSFAMCFLPVLLVYYPLLMYGVDRAKCGALPPYTVWLGNAVLLSIGVFLIRKVIRY